MYVLTAPPQAAPLAPVEIDSAQATIAPPRARTALHVRGERLNVLAGHRTSVTGTLLQSGRPAPAGEPIELQTLGRHRWRTLGRTRTGARGRFRLSYVPHRLGSRWVRLRFAGGADELASHRMLGRLNVFRLALASWYGGGGSLACGGSLTSATMGVANKTLPCGTLVTLRYGAHSVRVPVVDRGPYVAGREFDLTEATKQALGFGGVGEVWSTS
jgi:rare lipoprotein A